MDTESELVYDRMRLHRLKQANPDWSAARLGEAVSRCERWARKLLKRFKETAKPGLEMYLSRSRAPKHRSRQTPKEVKDIICELRVQLSEQYHRPAGASLIQLYLSKHPIKQSGKVSVPTSSRTITRILQERGYIAKPPKYEHQPLEPCAPMDE